MTIDTKRLRELAEAATPGPWVAEDYNEGEVYTVDPFKLVCKVWRHPQDQVAAFIAAANPQTVIALLDEVERLLERQQELLGTIVKVTNETPFADEAKDALKQRGALMAEIGSLKAQIRAMHGSTTELWRERMLEQQLAAMTKARDEACAWLDQYLPGSEIVAELRKVGK